MPHTVQYIYRDVSRFGNDNHTCGVGVGIDRHHQLRVEDTDTVGYFSDTSSAYWQAMVLFPLSEGFLVLPAAIVVSVWMDVANSSMSRLKVNTLNAHLICLLQHPVVIHKFMYVNLVVF